MLHALPIWASEGVFTIADRTEMRVRDPDPITNALALDVATAVDARATLRVPRWQYVLAYMPQFSALDVNGAGIHPAVMNTALVSADWHSGRTDIELAENAGYGDLTFESLSGIPTPESPATTGTPAGRPAPVPIVPLVPSAQSVRYASSETTLVSTLRLRPWTFTPRVGYQLSGGVDAPAQQQIPFQKGPFGSLSADYRLGARDHLDTLGTASETSFSNGPEALLVDLGEQWWHRWSRMTESVFGAGASVTRVRPAFDAPYVNDVSPVADAQLVQGFAQGPSKEQVRLDLRLAPFVNRLTGLVDQRITATLDGSWTRRRFSVLVFGTAGQSLEQGTVEFGRVLTAELDASYRAAHAVSFDAGARVIHQVQNAAGVAPAPPIVATTFTQTVIFLGVTVRAADTRF